MYYFAVGWSLFKRVWWPNIKLYLLSMVMIIPLVLGVVALIVATKAPASLNPRGWGLAGGIIVTVAVLALMPVLVYAYYAIASAPLYSESLKVWPHVKRGFSSWGRMARLGLVWLTASSPFLAVSVGTSFSGIRPYSTVWLWLASAATCVTGAYYGFAGLFAVREGTGWWESWKAAATLVPGRDWLKTVGLIVALELVAGFAYESTARTAAGILALPVLLLGSLYLSLCAVAVWDHYVSKRWSGA